MKKRRFTALILSLAMSFSLLPNFSAVFASEEPAVFDAENALQEENNAIPQAEEAPAEEPENGEETAKTFGGGYAFGEISNEDNGIELMAASIDTNVQLQSSNGFADNATPMKEDFAKQVTAHVETDGEETYAVIDRYNYIKGTSPKNIKIPSEFYKEATAEEDHPTVYPVKKIAANAFAGAELADVTFAEGCKIEEIGASAFASNNLGDGVSDYVFKLPQSVKTLGEACFSGNEKLQKFEFATNSALTEIPYDCFYDCRALNSINLGAAENVKKIGSRAFYRCEKLPYVKLPPNIDKEHGMGQLIFFNISDGTNCYVDCQNYYPGELKGAPWGNVEGYVKWKTDDKAAAAYENDSPFIIDDNGVIQGLKMQLEDIDSARSKGGALVSDTEGEKDFKDYRYYLKNSGSESDEGENGIKVWDFGSDEWNGYTFTYNSKDNKSEEHDGITVGCIEGADEDKTIKAATNSAVEGTFLDLSSCKQCYFEYTATKQGVLSFTVASKEANANANSVYFMINNKKEELLTYASSNPKVGDSKEYSVGLQKGDSIRVRGNNNKGFWLTALKFTPTGAANDLPEPYTAWHQGQNTSADSFDGYYEIGAYEGKENTVEVVRNIYADLTEPLSEGEATFETDVYLKSGSNATGIRIYLENNESTEHQPNEQTSNPVISEVLYGDKGSLYMTEGTSKSSVATIDKSGWYHVTIKTIYTDNNPSISVTVTDSEGKEIVSSQSATINEVTNKSLSRIRLVSRGSAVQSEKAINYDTDTRSYFANMTFTDDKISLVTPEPTAAPEPTATPAPVPEGLLDGTACISGSKTEFSLTIPKKVWRTDEAGNVLKDEEPIEITGIGDGAFGFKPTGGASLSYLKSVDFSALDNGKMKIIPQNAFWNCQKLQNVFFPKGLEEIGTMAFRRCYHLGDKHNAITTKDKETVNGSAKIKYGTDGNLILPSSLKIIGFWAFRECGSRGDVGLQNVIFDTTDSAGGDYSDLAHDDAPLKYIENEAFSSCTTLKNIYIEGVTYDPENGKEILGWDDYTDGIYTNERENPSHPFSAFAADVHYKNKNMDSATLVGRQTLEGGSYVYWEFNRLTHSVTKYLGTSTKDSNTISAPNYEGIDKLVIPTKLTLGTVSGDTFTEQAFEDENGVSHDTYDIIAVGQYLENTPIFEKDDETHIKNLTFPTQIETIYNAAFSDVQIDKITFEGSNVPTYEDGAVKQPDPATVNDNPSHLKTISYQAFRWNRKKQADNSKFTSPILFPQSLETIGNQAFENRNFSAQQKVKIGSGSGTAVGQLIIPGNVTDVSVTAFAGATGVGQVLIEEYRYIASDDTYNSALEQYYRAGENVYTRAPFGLTIDEGGITSVETKYMDEGEPVFSDYELDPFSADNPIHQVSAKADPSVAEHKDDAGEQKNEAVINLQVIMREKATNIFDVDYKRGYTVPSPKPTAEPTAPPETPDPNNIIKVESGKIEGFTVIGGTFEPVENTVKYENNTSTHYYVLDNGKIKFTAPADRDICTLVFDGEQAGSDAQIAVTAEDESTKSIYNVSIPLVSLTDSENIATASFKITGGTVYSVEKSSGSGSLHLYFVDMTEGAASLSSISNVPYADTPVRTEAVSTDGDNGIMLTSIMVGETVNNEWWSNIKNDIPQFKVIHRQIEGLNFEEENWWKGKQNGPAAQTSYKIDLTGIRGNGEAVFTTIYRPTGAGIEADSEPPTDSYAVPVDVFHEVFYNGNNNTAGSVPNYDEADPETTGEEKQGALKGQRTADDEDTFNSFVEGFNVPVQGPDYHTFRKLNGTDSYAFAGWLVVRGDNIVDGDHKPLDAAKVKEMYPGIESSLLNPIFTSTPEDVVAELNETKNAEDDLEFIPYTALYTEGGGTYTVNKEFDDITAKVEMKDEDITLFAIWATDSNREGIPDYYRLYYNMNGGTWENGETYGPNNRNDEGEDNLAYGETVSYDYVGKNYPLSSDVKPTREPINETNVVFVGWGDNDTYTGASDTSVKLNGYLNKQGVYVGLDDKVYDGESGIPTIDVSNIGIIKEKEIQKDKTVYDVYAIWAEDTFDPSKPDDTDGDGIADMYQVRYDANAEGEVTANIPTDTNEYANGVDVTVLRAGELPTRAGYTFKGWSKGEPTPENFDNLLQPGENFKKSAGLDVLYAIWESEGYGVVYHGNGNTHGNAPTDTDAEGNIIKYTKDASGSFTPSTVTIADNSEEFKRDYATFLGWVNKSTHDLFYGDKGSKTKKYNAGDVVTDSKDEPTDTELLKKPETTDFVPDDPEKTMNLYAMWAVDIYGNQNEDETGYKYSDDVADYLQVIYDLNAGQDPSATGAPRDMASYRVTATETPNVIITNGEPTRTGYKFKGWSLNEPKPNITVKPDADVDGNPVYDYSKVTLYAYNGEVTEPAADATYEEDFPKSSGKADILYAIWEPDKPPMEFNVIYHENHATSGSVPVDKDTYKFTNDPDSTVDVPIQQNTGKNPLERQNAVFLGWSLTPPSEEPYTTDPTKLEGAEQITLVQLVDGQLKATGIRREQVTDGFLHLYAVWAENMNGGDIPDYNETKVKLHYKLNGGTLGEHNVDFDEEYLPNTEVDLSAKIPKKDNAVFLGWTEKATTDNITTKEAADSFASTKLVKMEHTDKNVYAVWAVDANNSGIPDYLEYTVTFEQGEAEGSAAGMPADDDTRYNNVADGTAVTLPTELKWTGHIFAGWLADAESNVHKGSETSEANRLYQPGESFTMPNNNVNFTAQWKADDYVVIYHGNGQTSGTVPEDKEGAEQRKYTKTDTGYTPQVTLTTVNGDFKRTNAVLLGWSTTETGLITEEAQLIDVTVHKYGEASATFDFAPSPAEGKSMNLYAVWAIDENGNGTADYDETKVKLYYKLNGGKLGENETDFYEEYLPDNDVDLSAKIPTREKAVFFGWTETATTEDITTKEAASVTTIKSVKMGKTDKTVYAVWAVDENSDGIPDYLEYTVTFKQGAAGDNAKDMPKADDTRYNNVADGASVTLPTEPKWTGHIFAGWKATVGDVTNSNVTEGGDSTIFQPGESFTMPNNNVEFTAQWIDDDYVVIYHGNGHTGGTVPEDKDGDAQKKYTKTDTGYTPQVTLTAVNGDFKRTNAVLLGWSTTETGLITEEAQLEGVTVHKYGEDSATFDFAPSPAEGKSMNLYAVWAIDENGNGTADYEEDKYTLTYDYNGGTIDEADKKEDKDHLAGTTVSLDRTITPTHAPQGDADVVFVGWTEENNAKKVYGANETPPELKYTATFGTNEVGTDVTVYAVWAVDADKNGVPDYQDKKVRLIYNFDGGYIGTNDEAGKAPITVYYDKPTDKDLTVTLTNELNPTRGDKEVFIGWSLNKPEEGNRVAAAVMPDDLETEVIFSHVNPTDITVYAVYAVDNDEKDQPGHGNPDYNSFTVTYTTGDAGDSAVVSDDTTRYEPGETVILKSALTWYDHTFTGWMDVGKPDSDVQPKPGVKGAVYEAGASYTMPDHDVQFDAQWIDDNEYILRYHANNDKDEIKDGDTTYIKDASEEKYHKKESVSDYSVKLDKIESFTRTNAVFIGWTDEPHDILTTSPESQDITYYTSENEAGKALQFKPDKDGRIMHLYALWAEDTFGGNNPDGTIKPGDGKPDYSQVRYDKNTRDDVTGMPSDDGEYTTGASVTIQNGTPVRAGYKFEGWSLNKADGSGKVTEASFKKTDSLDVLYAIWSADYHVVYHGNGNSDGSVPVDETVYNVQSGGYDKQVTVKDNENGLTRTNATFLGWTTQEDWHLVTNEDGMPKPFYKAGDEIDFAPSVGTTTMHLYAVWAQDSNGYVYPTPEPGATPDPNATPIPGNHSGNSDNVPDYKQVFYNANVGAQVEVNGMPYDTAEYAKGASVNIKEGTPTRAGFVFKGWSLNNPNPNLDGDYSNLYNYGGSKSQFAKNDFADILYAIWEGDPTEYSIIYHENHATSGTVPTDENKYATGTNSSGYPTTAYVKDNEKNLERTDAAFLGWSLEQHDEPFAQEPSGFTVYTKDSTIDFTSEDIGRYLTNSGVLYLYAVWAEDANGNGTPDYEENRWVLEYDLNGGNYTGDNGDLIDNNDGKGYLPKTEVDIKSFDNKSFSKTEGEQKLALAGWSKDIQTGIISATGKEAGDEALIKALLEKTVMPTENPSVNMEHTKVYAVWAVDADGNGEPDFRTQYLRIVYKLDGGKHNGSEADIVLYRDRPTGDNTVTIEFNEAFAPTRNVNEIFVGWTLDAPGEGQFGNKLPGMERRAALTADADKNEVKKWLEESKSYVIDKDTVEVVVYAVYAVDTAGDPTDPPKQGNGNPDYNKYTVTYKPGVDEEGNELNDVTGMPSEPHAYHEPGDTVTVGGKPARKGYIFDGWTADHDGATTKYQPGETFTMPEADITLTAQWVKDEHELVYHGNVADNDGSWTADRTYSEDNGDKFTASDNTGEHAFTRSGYVFVGWTADNAADPIGSYGSAPDDMIKPGQNDVTFKISPNSNDMILYAVWAVDSNDKNGADYTEARYKLIYNLSGGKYNGNSAEIKDANGEYGGYIEDSVVYLNRSYAVGMTHDNNDNASVLFVGWTENESAKTKIYDVTDNVPTIADSVTIKNTDKTVYAVWAYDRDGDNVPDYQKGMVKLIYDLNGGTLDESPDDVIVYYAAQDEDREVTLNYERRPDHTPMNGKNVIFVGWSATDPKTDNMNNPLTRNEDKDTVKSYLKSSVTLTNRDVTVYAVYAVDEYKDGETNDGGNNVPDYNKYTVTYDLGSYTPLPEGVNTPKDKHDFHEPGDTVDLQDAPARNGYVFTGWLDATDSSVYSPDVEYNKYIMPERDVKFVAQWAQLGDYLVRYHLNGGKYNDGSGKTILEHGKTYVKDELVSETNKYYEKGTELNKVYDVTPYTNKKIADTDVYELTRPGAVFLGWTVGEAQPLQTTKPTLKIYGTAENPTIAYKPNDEENGGIVMNFFALWAEDSNGNGTPDYETGEHIQVTFEANDSTPANTTVQSGTMPTSPETVLKSVDYNIPGREPIREGYTFLGWKLKDSADSKLYRYGGENSAVDKSIMTKDITLVAQWSTTYSVVYDANGGKNAPTDDEGKTYAVGDNVTLKTEKPTRDGYVFLGWTAHTAQDPVTTQEMKDALDEIILSVGNTTQFELSPNSGTSMIFYAVWAEDTNGDTPGTGNGTPDYEEQWHIVYLYEGGTFNDHQTNGDDVTVSELTYLSSPESADITNGEGNRVFLNSAIVPTMENSSVAFAGWTEDEQYAKGTLATPISAALSDIQRKAVDGMLRNNIIIPKYSDWANYVYEGNEGYYPVYAVWAEDNNNDGVPDYLEGNIKLIYNLDGGNLSGVAADVVRYINMADVVEEDGYYTIPLDDLIKPSRGEKGVDPQVFVGWIDKAPGEADNDLDVTDDGHRASFTKDEKDKAEALILNPSEVKLASNLAEITVYALYADDKVNNGDDPTDPIDPENAPSPKPNDNPDYNRYTVTYDLGSLPDEVKAELTVPTDIHTYHEPKDVVDLAAAPEVNGYTFTGWEDTDGDRSVYIPGAERKYTMPERDVLFTAQWIPAGEYIVRYHLNGGKYNDTETAPVDTTTYIRDVDNPDKYYKKGTENGDQITEYEIVESDKTKLTRENATFLGWTVGEEHMLQTSKPTFDYYPQEGKTLGYKPDDGGVVMTLHALWAIDSDNNNIPDYEDGRYSVTLDDGVDPDDPNPVDPGTMPDSGSVLPNEDYPIPEKEPTRPGYDFDGWKIPDDPDDTVYKYDDPDNNEVPADKIPEDGVTLEAQWKLKEYSVVYDGNVADSSEVPVDNGLYTVEDTVTVAEHGTLAKTGYVFIGWTPHTAADPVMTKDAVPADMLEPGKAEKDTILFALSPESMVMKLFAVWAVDADGNGHPDYSEGFSVDFSHGVKPAEPDYNDGNPPVTNIPNPDEVLPNDDYTIPDNIPTRPGYEFEGWKDPNDPDGTVYQPGDTVDKDKITDDFTLEAQWKPTYIVVYQANGGAGNVPVDENKYAVDDPVTLASGETLAIENAVFIGWTAHRSEGVQVENPNTARIVYYEAGSQIPYEPDEGGMIMNLYALWALDLNNNGIPDYKEKYGITFDDGVKPEDPDYNPDQSPVEGIPDKKEDVLPGDTVTLPDTPPERPGYTFDGWKNPNDPDGELLKPGDSFTMPDGDVTVEPQWTKKPEATKSPSGGGGGGSSYRPPSYTLKYEENGGSEIPDEKHNQGTSVKLNKVPERDGYVFDGWYSDAELTKKVTSITMNNNTTVYAKWTEAAPDETANPNDGNGGASEPSIPDMLNSEDHFAYVVGYEDSTVRPNNNITRAETVAIFYRLLKSDIRNSNITTTNKYVDVESDKWYNQVISTLTKVGIVAGRSETTFEPDASITRAEFAAICARFDNTADVQPSGFSDIDNHWAKPEIERAATLGWVSGYGDGTFKPDQFITRAEAMTMINRVLGRVPENVDDLLDGMITWPDNTTDKWFYLAVQEATNGHYADKKDVIHEKWTQVDQSVTWDK